MMPDIVVIKTSSLGDVVHNLPAISDIRRHSPDAHICWVVEENYAPLVRLHPAVDEVVEVATRRWRRQLHSPAAWGEMRDLARKVRARKRDIVIDTQGLVRTAVIGRFVRGQRHGYDRGSIREPVASLLYDVRHSVSRTMHAIDRNRTLAAKALGYTFVDAPDFGLPRPTTASRERPYAVLLHASAQAAKEWPEASWAQVGTELEKSGIDVVLPWGDQRERQRSERLAKVLHRARVPERQPLDGVASMLGGAVLVVGLDTGLLHLAAALSVPLVGIFVNSDPALTGPRGNGPIAVLGHKGAPPEVAAVIAAAQQITSAGTSGH